MECLDILKISDIIIEVWEVYKKNFVDSPTVNKVIFYCQIVYWIKLSNKYSFSFLSTIEPIWYSDILFIKYKRIIRLNFLSLLKSVVSNIIVLFRSFEWRKTEFLSVFLKNIVRRDLGRAFAREAGVLFYSDRWTVQTLSSAKNRGLEVEHDRKDL